MYSWWTPTIALPLVEAVTGRRIWSRVQMLEEMQWQPRESLEKRASCKLGALIEHAARHVPYYRDLVRAARVDPRDLGGVADLGRIPVSRKVDLRDRFPNGLIAENLPARRRQPGTTSGSSGTPLEFFLDRQMTDRWVASFLFFLGWAGTALWHTSLIVAGPSSAPWIRERSRLATISRRLLLGEHPVLLDGRHLSVRRLAEIVSDLPRRPFYLWIYASTAERLAREMLDEGTRLSRTPQVVVCVSETLPPVGAENIGKAFSCPVVRHYSCLEVPRMAQQCPDNPSVYHVNSERCWIRLVDDDGRDVPTGVRGRVVVTDLDNQVMPLVNYDLGDLALAAEPCPCGRGLPTLGSIDGRESEIFTTPGGASISPTSLGQFLRRLRDFIPNVQEYQLRVDGPVTLALTIVPTSRFEPEYAATLESQLADLFGPEVTVSVETVDRLVTAPSGKRLIIRRVDPSTGS